jgi:Flp pilus assembly protein CpaB
MKPKTLILMLVAVACGLVAAYLAATLGGPRAESDGVQVLVALKDLGPNTVISDPTKMFAVKTFPKDAVPPGVISNPQNLQGKVLSRTVYQNVAVTTKDISQKDLLDVLCPPDHKIATIRLNQITGHVGFIVPGAHVDLLCTLAEEGPGQRRTWTGAFLQNVLVLAVNAHRGEVPATGAVPNPTSMSLALKPEDAYKLAAIEDRGAKISVLLRKKDDQKITKTPPFKLIPDNVFVGGAGPKTGGDTDESSFVEVWVARDNIDGLVSIKTAAELFEVRAVPKEMAKEGFPKQTPPQGFLQKPVAKGQPVTPWHFGAPPVAVANGKTSAPAPVNSIGMIIYEPGRRPQIYGRDGKLIEGGDSGGQTALPLAPSTPDGKDGNEPPLPPH